MGINIINEKCTGCGICVHECPVEAIHMHGGKARIDDDTCILCGACARICPAHAITFDKPHAENGSAFPGASGVMVFCERTRVGLSSVCFELLLKGRELAEKRHCELSATLFGSKPEALAQELIAAGADRVFTLDACQLDAFRDDAYAKTLAWLIEREKPEIVLAGATLLGRSFIPRVAALLKTGLTADCTELDIDDKGNLLQIRPAFGGNIMAQILCTRSRPQMATVRPHVFKPASPDPARRGALVKKTPPDDVLASDIEIVSMVRNIGETLSISDADIVVSGGMGLGKAEHFRLLQALAEVLGGAVGATRTAVDKGFAPHSCHIGQTGRTVCPKLYIAIGISGAIQHLVGMQTSEKILAINVDPDAPIFRVADYGLVGDLFDIVPALTEALRRLKKRN
jgi:electron transfer flavoprotein alpha subunit